ncbi:hypothetical protein B0H10DRAFT_2207473 [Mycena sp. CBHHK59/15]|nr:hypothetical protein B0H10DRAFT_2207473 [Mycena sp. CBHHK59/15]
MADLAEDYNSDEETALQPIDYNASRDDAFKALKSAQLRPKKRQVNEDMFGYKGQIVGLAKGFLLTPGFFLDRAAFQKDKPDAPENIRDQFTSDASYATSMAIALFEEVTPKFHPLLDVKTYSTFANDFISEHSDRRSAFLNTLRKALPTILNGLAIDSDILIWAKADRSKNPIIAGLLKFQHESKPGPYFMKTLRLMYFGLGSLGHKAKPASHSNGIKLGFKKVTEASMSAAATAIHLVLSRDTEWNAKGAVTGTNYEADYHAYMELLTFNRNQPHIKKIFKKVHDFVFAGVDLSIDSNADTDTDKEGEDDLNELMRRFELGTDATLLLDPAPPSPIMSEPLPSPLSSATPSVGAIESPHPTPSPPPRRGGRRTAVAAPMEESVGTSGSGGCAGSGNAGRGASKKPKKKK